LDAVLAAIADLNSLGYAQVLLMKLNCIISQNGIERAEKICEDFANQKASMEQKLRILDGFVCQILYQTDAAFLKNAKGLCAWRWTWHPARSL